jgi:hypothetical protein
LARSLRYTDTRRRGESREGFVVWSQVFESAGSFIPGLLLVVLAGARILLGYVAEEKAKRRRVERPEEPFAPAEISGAAPPGSSREILSGENSS